MINQKKTNPLHHNAGRLPNFNQQLSQHLSFANLQCKGFSGNLMAAERLLYGDTCARDYRNLPEIEQARLASFRAKLRNLAAEARELGEDLAEYNRDKTKLVLPKTVRSDHHEQMIKKHLSKLKDGA